MTTIPCRCKVNILLQEVIAVTLNLIKGRDGFPLHRITMLVAAALLTTDKMPVLAILEDDTFVPQYLRDTGVTAESLQVRLCQRVGVCAPGNDSFIALLDGCLRDHADGRAVGQRLAYRDGLPRRQTDIACVAVLRVPGNLHLPIDRHNANRRNAVSHIHTAGIVVAAIGKAGVGGKDIVADLGIVGYVKCTTVHIHTGCAVVTGTVLMCCESGGITADFSIAVHVERTFGLHIYTAGVAVNAFIVVSRDLAAVHVKCSGVHIYTQCIIPGNGAAVHCKATLYAVNSQVYATILRGGSGNFTLANAIAQRVIRVT